MRLREGDRMLLVGNDVTTLAADVTAEAVSVTVGDGTAVTEGSRYVIGTECVRVTGISGDTLTVARAMDTPVATHTSGDELLEVEDALVVDDARRHAGMLAPLRTPDLFLICPQQIAVSSRRAATEAGTPVWRRGSYQDAGGSRITEDTERGTIHTRSGLVICRREDGGHWEADVRRIP